MNEMRIESSHTPRCVALLEDRLHKVGYRKDMLKHIGSVYQAVYDFLVALENEEDATPQDICIAERVRDALWADMVGNRGKREKMYKSPWASLRWPEQEPVEPVWQKALARIQECSRTAAHWQIFMQDMLYMQERYRKQTIPFGDFRETVAATLTGQAMAALAIVTPKGSWEAGHVRQGLLLDHAFLEVLGDKATMTETPAAQDEDGEDVPARLREQQQALDAGFVGATEQVVWTFSDVEEEEPVTKRKEV